MLAPASFTQTVDRDAYAAARLITSKKCGVLRFTLPALAFCAVLVIAGLSVMFGSAVRSYDLLIKVAFALTTAAVCALVFLMFLPERVKACAERDYPVYQSLCGEVTVTMSADDMTLVGNTVTRRVEYAKVRVCTETADSFVIVTDDGHTVVLVKSCFTESEPTVRFFRDVFARVKR